MSSLNDPSFPGQYPAVIDQINQQLSQFPDSASSATTAQGEIVTAATIALTQIIGAAVLTDSDATTSRLASDSQVIAYAVRPRLILISNNVDINTTSQTQTSTISVDLAVMHFAC